MKFLSASRPTDCSMASMKLISSMGAWLPMLLGKLSPQPMILQADSFLPGEPIGAPMPMTLIVHPVTDKPGSAADAAADGTPLRCLAIRANGASEASRWYFTAKGEVHHVTFAGRLRWTPSDEKTVMFNFDPDVTAPR